MTAADARIAAEIIEKFVLDIAEIPDRNSPDDQPEMMLVTGDELLTRSREMLEEFSRRTAEAPKDVTREGCYCVADYGSVCNKCGKIHYGAEASKGEPVAWINGDGEFAELSWKPIYEAVPLYAHSHAADQDAERVMLARRVAELEGALASLRRSHYQCEDCWYSCPKSEDGCCNEGQGNECNCGADGHNAKIDALLAHKHAETEEGK